MSDSVVVTPPQRILHARSPAFPRLTFEYHPSSGKVYVVEEPAPGVNTARGVCIAEHCDTPARFYGFMQTWLRGYRKGRDEENVGTR